MIAVYTCIHIENQWSQLVSVFIGHDWGPQRK